MLSRDISALLILVGLSTSLSAQNPAAFEIRRDTNVSNNGTVSLVQTDLNSDGAPDVVFGENNNVIFLAGDGTGKFAAPRTAAIANAPISSITVADFNGDGKPDLLVTHAGSSQNAEVFLNNGNATFTGAIVVPATHIILTGTAGDFNGDGRPDIALGDSAGNAEIFTNVGGGLFVPSKTIQIAASTQVNQLIAASVNGNPAQDLVAEVYSGSPVYSAAYVLWNNGSGTFTPALLKQQSLGLNLNVGDVNQDGRTDVLVGYDCDTPSSSLNPQQTCYGVDVFYGLGANKTYERPALQYANGVTSLTAPATADVNHDGLSDIVDDLTFANGTKAGMAVWLQHPNGSFDTTPQLFLYGTRYANNTVLGDFNRDGQIDLVTGIGDLQFFFNVSPGRQCQESTINPTMTVCMPVDETYLPSQNSPLQGSASAYDKTPVTSFQEYLDGKLLYKFDNAVAAGISGPDLAPGGHLLVIKAYDANGLSFRSDRHLFGFNGFPGDTCYAAPGTASICRLGLTSTNATRFIGSGSTPNIPTAVQLYLDGALVVNDTGCDQNGQCNGGSTYLDTSVTLAPGNHTIAFKLWDAMGNTYQAITTEYVPPPPPPGQH